MKDHESAILHNVLIEDIENFLNQERQKSVSLEFILTPIKRPTRLLRGIKKTITSLYFYSSVVSLAGLALLSTATNLELSHPQIEAGTLLSIAGLSSLCKKLASDV